MCKEALHQAGMSVKLMMTCKDCAESENGQPAQACCPQCLEEQATALADHLELSGALSLLKDRDKRIEELEAERDNYKEQRYDSNRDNVTYHFRAVELETMCAKLAEALKVAKDAMETRDEILYADIEAVEAALKEWEDRK